MTQNIIDVLREMKREMKSKKRYITRNEIDQKEYKNKTRFPKKGANTHTLLHTYTNESNNFFSTNKSFKKKNYLVLNNFNKRNAITKTGFSSQNLAINTLSRIISSKT